MKTYVGRAWWAVCVSPTKWKGEEMGFSSPWRPREGPPGWLGECSGWPLCCRLEGWYLTLTGTYRGAASGRIEKNGSCVGSDYIAQTGHRCMSPGGPMWMGPPWECWQDHSKQILSRDSMHTAKCTNPDFLIHDMVGGWWHKKKFYSLGRKKITQEMLHYSNE